MVDRRGDRGLDRFIVVADPDGPRVLRDEAAALVPRHKFTLYES